MFTIHKTITRINIFILKMVIYIKLLNTFLRLYDEKYKRFFEKFESYKLPISAEHLSMTHVWRIARRMRNTISGVAFNWKNAKNVFE